MLAPLIAGLVPPDQPADVLILGFATPDVWPERATATFLSHRCPGRPLAFALCDQGCAAGFTALRLARDYVAGGRRVLVALAEQTRLDYVLPAPAARPSQHAAFAMLCDADAEAGPAPHAGEPADDGIRRQDAAAGEPGDNGAQLLNAVRVLPGVAADDVPAALRQALAALPAAERGDEKRPLVLGEGLAALGDGDVPGWRPAPLPPGQPLTGVWRELAAWAATPGGGRLAVADYDPGLRYLCLAAFAGA